MFTIVRLLKRLFYPAGAAFLERRTYKHKFENRRGRRQRPAGARFNDIFMY